MPAKPLSPEQQADAQRLRAAWKAYKAEHPAATQEWLADQCGWKTQAAVNQYLNGKIPLNLGALLSFSRAMGVVDPAQISPTLATKLGGRANQVIESQGRATSRLEQPAERGWDPLEAVSELELEHAISVLERVLEAKRAKRDSDRGHSVSVTRGGRSG